MILGFDWEWDVALEIVNEAAAAFETMEAKDGQEPKTSPNRDSKFLSQPEKPSPQSIQRRDKFDREFWEAM